MFPSVFYILFSGLVSVIGVIKLLVPVFAGLDVKCEACQRFFRDGLTISFTKILTDEAVSGWKFEIHVSLQSHCPIFFSVHKPSPMCK